MLRYGTSGCPVRALRSAAGRRVHWKSRRYLRLVFLIFGVNWRAALAACQSLLAGTGGAWASQPTESMRIHAGDAPDRDSATDA